MRIVLLIFILLFFSSCSSTKSFNIQNEFSLYDNESIYTFDTCSNNSYISKKNHEIYGKLFIEYISLNTSCQWNGFQRGYFERLFKDSFNLDSLKVIERFDYKTFEFTTYQIDEKYYIHLVYNYSISGDTFILDYSGIYFEKKVKEFDKNFSNKYINEKRFNKDYNRSLVNMNIFNNYFIREVLEIN